MSKAKSSPRVKKESAPESGMAKVEKQKMEVRPSGNPPRAEVLSRHGDGMVTRKGKGFSVGEIGRASFPMALASRWSIPIDLRRRSVLEANVQALTKWRPAPTETTKPARVEAARPKVTTRRKPAKKRPSANKKKKAKRKSSAR